MSNEQTKFTIFATVIAAVSSELLQSLSSDIFIPLIDGDCNKDGKPDIQHNIKSKTSHVGKKVLNTGNFIYVLINHMF